MSDMDHATQSILGVIDESVHTTQMQLASARTGKEIARRHKRAVQALVDQNHVRGMPSPHASSLAREAAASLASIDRRRVAAAIVASSDVQPAAYIPAQPRAAADVGARIDKILQQGSAIIACLQQNKEVPP